MITFYRALRVALIVTALGCCVSAVKYKTRQNDRIREVRKRISPPLKLELEAAGLAWGNPAFLRIFKETRELELWLKPTGSPQYKLWKAWPIAAMSGKLGPKLKEGDLQAPEGFYSTSAKAMNPASAYHLSFNIGYPNAYDRGNKRTGGLIMIHGNKVSVGCFAMTDPVIEEIYVVVEAAITHGQKEVPIHVFPFRMTDERMAKPEDADNPWMPFWQNLQEGYRAFEDSRVPPHIKYSPEEHQVLQTP